MNQSRRIFVLGLGNDILTDDAVGLKVADLLSARFSGRGDIKVDRTCEMGLSLLDLVVGYHALALVDAIQTRQREPGFVHALDLEDLASLPPVAPHFLGVAETLALGKQLGLEVPGSVKLFAVEVEDPFTVGVSLTPALEAALPAITDQIGIAIERMG